MTPTPEQVAQWAREAGSTPYTNRHFEGRTYNAFSPEQLHRLVTRAYNEGRVEQAESDIDDVAFYGGSVEIEAAIRANAPKVTA